MSDAAAEKVRKGVKHIWNKLTGRGYKKQYEKLMAQRAEEQRAEREELIREVDLIHYYMQHSPRTRAMMHRPWELERRGSLLPTRNASASQAQQSADPPPPPRRKSPR